MDIVIEHNPSDERLDELGVMGWPVWEKKRSEFPWRYDEVEVAYITEGEVIVTPQGGKPVTIKTGDLVTFPKGMACHWKITKDLKKHYKY